MNKRARAQASQGDRSVRDTVFDLFLLNELNPNEAARKAADEIFADFETEIFDKVHRSVESHQAA